ncbi:MAG: cellulase family glycosylhydrolase, partial [Kiritimatiellae bacterium]|nr:cellulase family glycosylhydrolase [Kiritimatiellia bacterium]
VAGNRLVGPDDAEVWLQGVNAGGMESVPTADQIVKSVVVAVDEWKANCVRLPVTEAFWNGASAYQEDGGAGYRAAVDKIVTLAANRGAYVVIDLHRFRAPKAEHAAFWKDVAARYRNHPAVLFDLFNEPHDIDWKTWRDGGWVGKKGAHDESAFLSDEEKRKNQGFQSVGMQSLVDAVRAAGARNVVIAGGLFWANDLTGIESEAIERGEATSYRLDDRGGNGVMYAWHTYHWHAGWARILPVAAKHPVFLGEVGAAPREEMTFIPMSEKEDPYAFSPNMIGFIQKHRINWTAWCFHPKAAPCMIKSWDYDPTPYWGEFVRRALGGEAFELKRMK